MESAKWLFDGIVPWFSTVIGRRKLLTVSLGPNDSKILKDWRGSPDFFLMCLVQGKSGMIEDVHGGHVVGVIYLCCLCHSIPPFIIVESGSGGLNLFVSGLLVPEGRKGGARRSLPANPFLLLSVPAQL